MNTLFEKIRIEVETNMDGWATVEKAQTLAALILAIRPKLVVEIGVWAGRSFVPMAMALNHLKSGKAIAIDPWSAQVSAEGMTGVDLEWWKNVDHDAIFQKFIGRLTRSGATTFTEIYRTTSKEFDCEKLPGLIDILHLDGNHSDDASCGDVMKFAPLVRAGGFLFMDDIEWAKKATEMLGTYGFQKMYPIDTGAFFQKIA